MASPLLRGLRLMLDKVFWKKGIFSIKATPLGPNICLFEENVECHLEVLLYDGGDWKRIWFKEVRMWKPTDVECFMESGFLCMGYLVMLEMLDS